MSIIGVGIDVAEIERFAASMERTPGLAERLFLRSELLLPSGERRGAASLAARFAGAGERRRPGGRTGRTGMACVAESRRGRGLGGGGGRRVRRAGAAAG